MGKKLEEIMANLPEENQEEIERKAEQLAEDYAKHLEEVGKSKYRKYPLKDYEIWVGYYHLGQGYHPPSEPLMVAKIKAPHFRAACAIYELESALNSLKSEIEKDHYVADPPHLGVWFYKHHENYNSWTGQYYETEEEAWKSFKS